MPSNDPDLFEHAFQHASVGMALVAIDGRWLKVNDALCRLVGYPRQELLTTSFQALTHPDDLEGDLSQVRRLVEAEIESYELEKRYVRKDGSYVWSLLSVSMVRDADERPRFFIAQIQDISRRKRAESDIERFFRISPDMLAIVGSSGKLDIVSPAWQRTLGWTLEELTTRDFIDFVHPDDRDHTMAEAARVYRGVPVPGFRNRCLTRAGDYRWLEWNTSFADDGRLFCVVRDVSSRVSEERARSWLAAIVENAGEAIIGVDAEGEIFSWNRGAERLYNYPAHEIIGRPISILGADDAGRAAIHGVWQRAVAGAKHQEYDASRARSDGSLVDVHVQVRAVEDAQGEVLGWSVSARDITEQKRLADALAQQVHLYSAIARSLPGGAVTVFDRELLFVTAEGELLATLGVDKHQLVGKSLAEHSTAANRDSLLHLYRRALEGVSTEIEAERAGRLLLIRVAPLHDAHGAISGGMVLSLDVTAQRRQALLLRTIAENVPNSAIAVFDRALRITYAAGHKLYEAAHCGPEQLEGKSLGALTGEDRQSLYRATFDGEIVTDEQTRFGRVFELRALPIRDLRGEIASGLLLIYDVSARRDEAEELRRAKLLLEATIANMQDGVSLLDVDKRILLANDAYASLFGRSREDLVGLGPTDFFALVASRFEQPELFGELLRAQAQSSVELVLRLPRRRVLRRTITAVGGHGAGGQAVGEQGCGPESPSAGKSVAGTSQAGYLVVWQDVTADSDMREQRRHEAMTDALTGIANRRAAQAALESAVAQRSDPNVPLSVALFDIDHFKRINDLHGHPFGDVVIREVARVVAAQTRTSDLAARWGGEEFIAIIAATREGATVFCERVRAAVRALSWPELAGLTISAGVATRTANESAHALIKRADEQLYRAKGSGRDRVSW